MDWKILFDEEFDPEFEALPSQVRMNFTPRQSGLNGSDLKLVARGSTRSRVLSSPT